MESAWAKPKAWLTRPWPWAEVKDEEGEVTPSGPSLGETLARLRKTGMTETEGAEGALLLLLLRKDCWEDEGRGSMVMRLSSDVFLRRMGLPGEASGDPKDRGEA